MGEQKERPALDLITTFEHFRTAEPEFYKRLQSEMITICVFPGCEYLEDVNSEYAIWQRDQSVMHGRTELEVPALEREIESAIRVLREKGFSIYYMPHREKRRHSARRRNL